MPEHCQEKRKGPTQMKPDSMFRPPGHPRCCLGFSLWLLASIFCLDSTMNFFPKFCMFFMQNSVNSQNLPDFRHANIDHESAGVRR